VSRSYSAAFLNQHVVYCKRENNFFDPANSGAKKSEGRNPNSEELLDSNCCRGKLKLRKQEAEIPIQEYGLLPMNLAMSKPPRFPLTPALSVRGP
jgi:hypothetical protein